MKKAVAFLLLYSFIFHFSTVNAMDNQLSKPSVNSEAAIIMDADNGIILYQKNIEEKLYPASITKVMTALVAINSVGDNLDARIAFSPKAVDLPPGSSTIYMLAGDSLSFTEALYGLMIASANEIANALAEDTRSSYDDFIDEMNREAALLGAKNTHFVNPSGLYDDNHYTCAYDMALFMREAIKSPVFVDAISKINYHLPPTEQFEGSRPLNTQNMLMAPGSPYNRDYIVGSKSGYVDESKRTLVTYAEQDGHKLIAVVMRAEKRPDDYEDTIAMLDYGFSCYRHTVVLDAASVVISAQVEMVPGNPKSSRSVALYADENVEGEYPACVNEQTISLEQKIPEYMSPPVRAGDIIGTLMVKYQDVTLKEIGLYATESIAKPEPTAALTSAPPAEAAPSDPRYAKGFSFGFLGDIFSGIISSFAPIELNPVYPMILVITLAIILMVYFMSVFLHGKNRNREKELLKFINRNRKK